MTRPSTRRNGLVGLLGSIVFVATAVYWIRTGESVPLAWVAVVFFGVAGLACAYVLITGRPYIVPPAESRIVLEPGGFAVVTTRGRRFAVQWTGVKRVVAYKRDLFTTDEICVAFVSGDSSTVQEVSEEWPGFQEMFGPMEKELGISPAWYLEIMTPVFEATPRVLLDRATAATPGTPRVEPGLGL